MAKEEKIKKVGELKKNIEASPVIALVDMHKMPSKQLQEIRKCLRGKAKIKMIKKVILKFAIDGMDKKNIKELESNIPTQPAVVFTDIEAFKFYNLVNGLRFKTFAKEGDVPNEDIWVSAGPTNLMAGPVISELQNIGVKASIEGGRIMIKKDSCVAKKGESISAAKANVLRKLKIVPTDVSLNIVAIYDNGDIYEKEVLELTKTFPQMMVNAFKNALNLSVFVAYPTKENISYLIAKATRAANAIKRLVGGPKGDEMPETEGNKKETEEEVSSDNLESGVNEKHGGAS